MGPNDPPKRFLVDIMLGKLARWLRILGFDTRIAPLRERSQIQSLLCQGMIPVTRTEKWRGIEGLVFIQNNDPFEQLKELISSLALRPDHLRPFTRCSGCNSELARIPKNEAFGGVPDFIYETVRDFRQCPRCRKVYWPGSHKDHMLEKLEEVLGWRPQPDLLQIHRRDAEIAEESNNK